MTMEASVQLNCPVEAVYTFLTNLENLKAVQTGIMVVALDGPLAVGTHYVMKGQIMGQDFSSENEVVALEPNKTFGIKTFATPPASPITTIYKLETSGRGTRLNATVETSANNLNDDRDEVVQTQLKAGLHGTLAAIKKIIET